MRDKPVVWLEYRNSSGYNKMAEGMASLGGGYNDRCGIEIVAVFFVLYKLYELSNKMNFIMWISW